MYTLENDEIEIDLLELFKVLKSKVLVIILTTLIFIAGSGILTMFVITPTYSSSVQLYVVSSNNLSDLTSLQLETQLTQDYMMVVETRTVLEEVINNLSLDMEYEELDGKITVENPSDTRIMKITVSDSDPKEAQVIAREVAKVTAATVSEKMDIKEPTVIEDAYLADEPDSPSLKLNIVIGAFLGLVLSVGAITINYVLNDTIRKEEDIERYLEINTLAKLPLAKGEKRHKKKVRKAK